MMESMYQLHMNYNEALRGHSSRDRLDIKDSPLDLQLETKNKLVKMPPESDELILYKFCHHV